MACRLFRRRIVWVSKSAERSSAWLEHLVWDQDVAGSNPVAPTIFRSAVGFSVVKERNGTEARRCSVLSRLLGASEKSNDSRHCRYKCFCRNGVVFELW